MLFHRELKENLSVCTSCDHHMSISPRDRFEALFDGGIFAEIPVPQPITDPLVFKDQKKYPERMKAAQKSTGEKEAMLIAEGDMGRTPIVAAAQDFSFMGGSMGMYVGNAIIAAAERAVKLKRPLGSVFGSRRRTHAGRYPVTHADAAHHGCRGNAQRSQPSLYRRADPSDNRRVTASYAMLGDVHIAEPNALICFAGPRVIEQTIREKLPEGFQRAEYLLDHGMLDRVTHRRQLRDELITILRMLMGQPPAVKGDLPAPDEAISNRRKRKPRSDHSDIGRHP